MWELEKAILVTNNDRVYEKYKDQMKVILLDGYEDVLIKVRDLVYDKHVLLTHPQASSLKPNQTPYRSVVVYPKGEEDNMKDIMLIDKCIQVYQKWQDEIIGFQRLQTEMKRYGFLPEWPLKTEQGARTYETTGEGKAPKGSRGGEKRSANQAGGTRAKRLPDKRKLYGSASRQRRPSGSDGHKGAFPVLWMA